MHIENITNESYKTIFGKTQTKTTSQIFNQEKTKRCQVTVWGDKGNTTVEFFEDANPRFKPYHFADFGSYESALGACLRSFSDWDKAAVATPTVNIGGLFT